MARVLIVGCGCRGRQLAGTLAEEGHALRGTTRDSARLAEIEAAGVEAVLADPDRLGTVLAAVEGVSVVVWLLGNATGESVRDAHGPRLATLLEKLVDTPVRGFVYEGRGSVPAGLLAGGAELVREAGQRWRIPVEVVEEEHPAASVAWLDAMRAAVERTLS